LIGVGIDFAFPTVANTGVDTCDQGGCEQPQYVVRGGEGKARDFEKGTAMTQNGFGFSVQTAPGVIVEELARGGGYPNKQISVTTVDRLQSIPGVIVTTGTQGAGDYHGTVNIPYPARSGVFDSISGVFTPQPNPFPVPKGR
jgi:hypothetical protein